MTGTATTFKIIVASIGFSFLYFGSDAHKASEPPRKATTIRLDEECLKKQRDTAYYKSGEIMAKLAH